jgi:hypothetical protein
MINQKLAARVVAILITSAGLFVVGGCTTPKGPPPAQWYSGDESVTVNVPPKELVKLVQQALAAPPISLPAEDVQNGSVVTAWKEERGEFHIIRYWHKRTRYRINIVPDFNEPTAKSHLSLDDQPEERATDHQPWYPAPQLHDPDKSQELLKRIVDYVATQQPAQR